MSLRKNSRAVQLVAACLPVLPLQVHAHAQHREQLHGFADLHWNFDPWVVLPLALAGAFYLAGIIRLWRASAPGSGVSRRRAGSYALGWVMLIVALVTPLDPLGEALFSAHMVQHELLMLVAAPLLVLGRPLAVFVWALPLSWRRGVGAVTRARPVASVWAHLMHPLSAWVIHALVLWGWHAPPLFQASVLDPTIHTIQHFSFLLAALLFWWTLLSPRDRQGGAAVAVLYLLTTAMHTGMLGALLTFSTRIWYPVYAPLTPYWGLSPLQDQQLGGLIMWVPGGLAYLLAALWLAARMLRADDAARARHMHTRRVDLA